jgi:hypothetical protein
LNFQKFGTPWWVRKGIIDTKNILGMMKTLQRNKQYGNESRCKNPKNDKVTCKHLAKKNLK